MNAFRRMRSMRSVTVSCRWCRAIDLKWTNDECKAVPKMASVKSKRQVIRKRAAVVEQRVKHKSIGLPSKEEDKEAAVKQWRLVVVRVKDDPLLSRPVSASRKAGSHHLPATTRRYLASVLQRCPYILTTTTTCTAIRAGTCLSDRQHVELRGGGEGR